jgi:hypothetical protein
MPLKVDPKYGFYPWWPEDGDAWLHPEDVELARGMVPSTRVFRRDGMHGPYIVLHYGDMQMRVKRTLWQEVPSEGYEIGDMVEVLSRGMKNTPRTGVIREIFWEPRSRTMRYQIAEGDASVPNLYSAEDLRHVEPAIEREEVVIQPSGDDADAALL